MTPIDYLNSVLARYNPAPLLFLPLTPAYLAVTPIIRQWGHTYIDNVKISGSNAKGTAIAGVADLDLFISLHSHTLNSLTLSEVFNSLEQFIVSSGYTPRRQNVSIRINHLGTEIDIVPAVKFSGNTNDHWLHITKSGRDRTKTNVDSHIRRVTQSGRINEIRLTKIWRKINNLDFPSIYLEEVVINCLSGHWIGNIATNFWEVLGYLSTNFTNDRIIDPANSANIISNDLTVAEKNLIRTCAMSSRRQSNWGSIVQ